MVMNLRKMLVRGAVAIAVLGLAACSSGSSSDNNAVVNDDPPEKAIPSGLSPTLISTLSVETDDVATDGQWLAWTGLDRQGIYISDGLETENQTENLSVEYYPQKFVFDGRYTAFITTSRKQLFVVDNQDAASTPVLITESADWIEFVCVNNGELVWIDNADDILYHVDLNSGTLAPTAITDGAIRKRGCKVDNGLIVWSGAVDTGSDTHWRVFYCDLKSPAPAIVQPSGQTGYDHWMTSVHDQFIVWQGSDSGPDVEIFYCDLRQNPSASVQLTHNTTDDREPQVENKVIVWNGYSAGGQIISYIDMNDASPSINQLPTAAQYDRLGHFRDGVIAWMARGSFYQIFYYDLNDSTPEVVQLTDDGFDNLYPRIANGQIVWRTEEADGARILARDLASSLTDEVADLPYTEIVAVLAENSRYVWLSKGLNRRIYAQPADGDTLDPVAVTPPDVDVGSLEIDNGIAVLRAFDGAVIQVYYCDLNADTHPLVKLSDNNTYNGFPRIEGDIVVWSGQDAGGVDQIFYADLASDAPAGVAIGVDGEANIQCAVSDGIITWLGGIYPDYEVYYYDVNAPLPQAVNLTDNTIWETSPRINQGIIAWSRQHTGNINDVWYYDLYADSPLEIQVTDSDVSDDRIQAISDDVLVWISDYQNIFFYDLDAVSPAPVQVATDLSYLGSLSFDQGKLVWYVDGEIYGYDLYASNPEQIRITENEINDFSPRNRGDFIIWKGADATYAARW